MLLIFAAAVPFLNARVIPKIGLGKRLPYEALHLHILQFVKQLKQDVYLVTLDTDAEQSSALPEFSSTDPDELDLLTSSGRSSILQGKRGRVSDDDEEEAAAIDGTEETRTGNPR